MDWAKMGAIFTMGCFVVAGLTLLFQIKPLPWFSPSSLRAVQPRYSKLMAAFIVLGFLVSGLTVWMAWHPVPRFAYPPDFTHLKRIDCAEQKGKVFINETVVLPSNLDSQGLVF